MHVLVVDLGDDRGAFEAQFPSVAGLSRILYVSLPRHTNLFFLDEMVRSAVKDNIRRAIDLAVFRLHQGEARELLSDPKLVDRLARRFEDCPLAALVLQTQKPTLLRLEKNGASAAWLNQHDNLVKVLRKAEIASFALTPSALLPRVDSFHYEGPNGDHYEEFLRVGIALQTPNALDAVAFWLSEWLEGRSIVLFDSPTLVAVGLSTEGYYRELTGDAPPIFDYLKNYDESAQSVANRVRQRIQRASPSGRDLACLFVNSLHSSGRLARRVAQGLSAVSEISSLSNVSLFAASSGEKGAVDGEVFSELEQRFLRHSAAACPRCQDGSHVVGIEHRSYLLELAAASETARINIKDAQPVRDFLDRYAGIDAISLHRDRHDGARHHGIHIDVKPLLKSPSFRARLQEKTQPLNQAVDVIVAPNHKGAISLAKMVNTKLKARLIVCDERDLASLPAHDKTSIRRARGLLIVDDVLITGHRLRGYKNFLQRSALIGQSTLVGALVAVERPINRQELRGIRDCFFGALGLIGVESILLPDWDKPDCPWCIEYERWNAAIRNRRDVTARHTLLADTRKGLADDAFLGWSKTSRRHLRLGPQSIFGRGLNQAEIMTAVAGALQELRDSGKLNDRPVTPVAKLLHPGFYLTGRYYDPVILAAVLRCCQRHDLYATATEKSVRRALMSHLDRTANDAAWGEVLLAIGIGKLPKVELAPTRARHCRGETARLLKHLFSSNPMEPLATSN